jgi:hypothetical protein
VLVQTNYGGVLSIDGVPIGRLLGRYAYQGVAAGGPGGADARGDGSCMIVVATDAPLDARDLKRLAARAVFGLARTGSSYSNGSGDFAIAWSTAPALRVRFGEEAPAAADAAAHRRRVATVPGRARDHRGGGLQLALRRDHGDQRDREPPTRCRSISVRELLDATGPGERLTCGRRGRNLSAPVMHLIPPPFAIIANVGRGAFGCRPLLGFCFIGGLLGPSPSVSG